MTLCDEASVYEFGWCQHYTFSDLSGIQEVQASLRSYRLYYISTEVERIYLVFQCGEFKWIPFTLSNYVWSEVPKHRWKVQAVAQEALVSEESLHEAIKFQMLLQFRDSVIGYYEEPPTQDYIMSCVDVNSTVDTLKHQHFTVYATVVQEDPEWDGAVQVLCEDGWLLFPYVKQSDGSKKLIPKYATYCPESFVGHLFKCAVTKFDKVVSLPSNIHWSVLRNKLEKFGRTE